MLPQLLKTLLYFVTALDVVILVSGNGIKLRIAGGYPAEEGSAQYQVSIQTKRGIYSCGGSIINQKTILTSAQCTDIINPKSVVEYGSNCLGCGDANRIESYLNHPRYKIDKTLGYFHIQNDIALVYVLGSMRLSNFPAKAIALNRNPIRAGELAIATGFGKLGPNGAISNELQMADMTTKKQCDNPNLQYFICADSVYSGLCNGDIGSPLVLNEKLIGIASFGACASGTENGFTDVSAYFDWIESNLR